MKLSTDNYVDGDGEYASSVSGNDFKTIEALVVSVNRKVKDLRIIQKYQTDKEEDFSQKQADNLNLVKKVALAQIVIVLLIGLYQIFSLRKMLLLKTWVMS